jgi:hypothetical protein
MNRQDQSHKAAEQRREQEMQKHVQEERRRNIAEMQRDSGRSQLNQTHQAREQKSHA